MRALITLLTDYGLHDTYAGQIKGAIAAIAPDALVIDLSHDVPPQNIRAGALMLEMALPPFAEDTIHMAVVDPGVGTARAAIAVQSERGVFVGPDNGLLSAALPPAARPARRLPERVALPPGVRAVRLDDRRWWRESVSATFHGRDVFGPVAAHLAAGVPLDDLGPAVDSMVALPPFRAERGEDGTLRATVMLVDRFGNVITDCAATQAPAAAVVTCNGHDVVGMATTYGDGRELIALINSGGYLEIALPGGNAAACMGVRAGDVVLVSPAPQS